MATVSVQCTRGANEATFEVPSTTLLVDLWSALESMPGWNDQGLSGPTPTAVEVSISGMVLPVADFLDSMGDGATLDDAGPISFIINDAATTNPEPVCLKVYAADGTTEVATLTLPASELTAAQLLQQLDTMFEGDVRASTVQFPSNLAGKWWPLPASLTDDMETPLLARVSAKIDSMPVKMQPPKPEGVESLRIRLAAEVSVIETAEGADAATGDTDPDAAKFNADKLASLTKVIATSKSGGDQAGRDWMTKLTNGLLSFASSNPNSDKSSATGWFTCSLCHVTNQCDTAHGGTLRHCGGVGHIKKLLESHVDETMTASEVRTQLPKVWGGNRVFATAQFKVAAQERQRKGLMARVTQQVVAEMAAGADSPMPAAVPAAATPTTIEGGRAVHAAAALADADAVARNLATL